MSSTNGTGKHAAEGGDAKGDAAKDEEQRNINDEEMNVDGETKEEENASTRVFQTDIPTKQHDGGTPRDGGTVTGDAFARYSNQNARMTRLLGLERVDQDASLDTAWRRIMGYLGLRRLRNDAGSSNERLTRVTTELYPDYFQANDAVPLNDQEQDDQAGQ